MRQQSQQIHNPLQDFTRGGQILMHAIRMMAQVSKHLIRILTLFILIFNAAWLWLKTSEQDRYILFKWLQAELYSEFSYADKPINFVQPGVAAINISAESILQNISIQQHIQMLENLALSGLWFSGIGCLIIIGLTILFFIRSGANRRSAKFRRGTTFMLSNQLKRLLKREKAASNFQLAKVPLVKDAETKHLLITGSSGTGKTVAITELLDQVRQKGQRAIVYDKMGAFVKTYYREGQDVLLNPLDTRCPNWNIWSEGTTPTTYDMMASALIPSVPAHVDKTWMENAKVLFAAVAEKLYAKGNATTQNLLNNLLTADIEKLANFVKGTPAEPLISAKAEKFAQSVMGTLAPAIKPLRTLVNQEQSDALFSIRQWVENDNDDAWLFISSRADQHATIRPLISLWLELATNSLLSLPADFNRRIWTVIDELPSLQKIPSLSSALAESRQFGGCMLLSIQTIAQLREIYGRDGAESLSGLCNTRLSFRTPDPATADWVSKSLGQSELDEAREGLSYGAHEFRDGVSIQSQTLVRPVVLASEILALEDLAGFLRLPGAWPITKLEFQPKTRKPATIPFIAKTASPFQHTIEPKQQTKNFTPDVECDENGLVFKREQENSL